MAADTIRFYLDENVSPVIAQQLRRRGIEVFTAQELGVLGDEDQTHLQRATEMGCVLCTHDTDFLILAADSAAHNGIVFGNQRVHDVGDWVSALELLHAIYAPAEMYNHVEYL